MSRKTSEMSFRISNSRYFPAFCKCKFPDVRTLTNYKGHIPDLIKCRCGEMALEDKEDGCQWKWQDHQKKPVSLGSNDENNNEENFFIAKNGKDVTFHPTYSQGTSLIRGDTSLKVGMIHFWEVRIITALTGTDVMFGIGTDKVNLNDFQFHFTSALGKNACSWGFSYNGRIHHKGIVKSYGQPFSQGCLVGIYLDRSKGFLEFFLNRQSMGIAYKNIPLDPSIEIYPMVSSTAARSCITLVNATSIEDSLQFRAIEALALNKANIFSYIYKEIPGLRLLLKEYWFLSVISSSSTKENSKNHSFSDLRKHLFGSTSSLSSMENSNDFSALLLYRKLAKDKASRKIYKEDKDHTDYDYEAFKKAIPSDYRLKRKQKFQPTLDNIKDDTNDNDLCSSCEKIPMQKHPQSEQPHYQETLFCHNLKQFQNKKISQTYAPESIYDNFKVYDLSLACQEPLASSSPPCPATSSSSSSALTTQASNSDSYQDYMHYIL